MNKKEIRKAINKFGPWYQRYQMKGIWTTDNMLTGEHIWPGIRGLMDDDLEDARILDIGSNAGYYSTMLAIEGADVVSVEPSDLYFKQAQWTKYYFEKEHNKKLTIELMKKTASQLDYFDLGWFDYILAISVIYFIGRDKEGKYSEAALKEQKRVVSEICQQTDRVIVRTRNKVKHSSVAYYTQVFLENDFYMLKRLQAKRPTVLYGRLYNDGDYGWKE